MPTMPQKPSLFILIAVTAMGPLAVNIILPSMPGLVTELDTDYATVQLTLSLYLMGLSIAQLAYGPLSDRYGRRPLMLIGLGVFLSGGLICALAPNITTLIAGRLLQAIGGCAGTVLGRAMVRDMYDREQSASMIAYITMSMVVAPMLAPIIGGLVDEWLGWRYSFVFVTTVGSLVLLGCTLFLPETNDRSRYRNTGGTDLRFIGLLRIPAFYGYTLQLSFSSAVFFAFLGGAPFVVVNQMGYPPSSFGLYFIIVAACYMTGNFFAARFSTRIGGDRMILIGTTVSLFGAVTLGGVYLFVGLIPATLFGGMGAIAMGNGISIPNGLAGAISVDSRQVGAASGISGFTQMAFGAMATMLVGGLLADTPAPLVIFMVIGAALSFGVHIVGARLVRNHSGT